MKLFVKRYSLDNVVQTSATRYLTIDVLAKGKRSRLLTILNIFSNRSTRRGSWLAPSSFDGGPYLPSVGKCGDIRVIKCTRSESKQSRVMIATGAAFPVQSRFGQWPLLRVEAAAWQFNACRA